MDIIAAVRRGSNPCKRRSAKQTLMAAVAAAAVLAGAIIAIATAGGQSHTRAGGAPTPGQAARPAGRGELAVAAGYLGLTTARLRDELHGGRTLAQVASSIRGRSTGGLIDALVGPRAARLASAVAAGRLSTAGESARIARLRHRFLVAVNRRKRNR